MKFGKFLNVVHPYIAVLGHVTTVPCSTSVWLCGCFQPPGAYQNVCECEWGKGGGVRPGKLPLNCKEKSYLGVADTTSHDSPTAHSQEKIKKNPSQLEPVLFSLFHGINPFWQSQGSLSSG